MKYVGLSLFSFITFLTLYFIISILKKKKSIKNPYIILLIILFLISLRFIVRIIGG